MNITKAAATLSLLIATAEIAFLLYETYQDVVLLRSSIDGLGGGAHNQVLEYWIPGAVAAAALVTSLALFGSAREGDR